MDLTRYPQPFPFSLDADLRERLLDQGPTAKGSPCFLGGHEEQQGDRDRSKGSPNGEKAVERSAGSHCERSAFSWRSLGSGMAASLVSIPPGPLNKAPYDW